MNLRMLFLPKVTFYWLFSGAAGRWNGLDFSDLAALFTMIVGQGSKTRKPAA